MWHTFYLQVLEAEAHPRTRALGIIYKEMPDRPDLAWKFIERREPGYEPAVPSVQPPQGPTVIQLVLTDDGSPFHLIQGEIEDGEVVDEQDGSTDPDRALPDHTG